MVCAIEGAYAWASSSVVSRLLVGPATELQPASMAAPLDRLTAQDYIYAASALRAEAVRAQEWAKDPAQGASRQIYERAAVVYRELAAKFDRIAKRLASK
jgi:hypothetical protein